ncbi:glycoside hydrolase family 3 C-terminal domain-containing protein [Termitidicoccus mucosus]|uniref:Fibronectin type III-like domain-containing protein n=1 Tax=Termitidicoccus mucosus TaxID=1184151 RepID=A0A178IA91_9BACT|nr:hypothetical protein AW736_25510 [Opitutaceae bacterium TSB47]
MKHLPASLVLLSIALSLSAAPDAGVAALLRRPAAPAAAVAQAGRLLALLTPEERFEMVAGGNSFGISGVPRLGIPPVHFADASAGIRIIKGTPTEVYEKTTAFPCTMTLAATWDCGLAAAYAAAIGEEMRAGGVHVLLGPGMNGYRLSVGGRNFEYFGEDPFLVSRMVENYVRGLQGRGVGATLKHFIGNEAEHYRRSSNSVIDERTLQEIYLPPFKAGVDAGAWAVMTSYNQVNGEWAGQDSAIVNGLLRGRLGFQWLCMTDWASTWDGEKLAASGNDLEKPDGFSLRRAREKLLGSPAIDRMALSILKTCIAAGFYEPDFHKPELMGRWKERAGVARTVNDRGIVLLQNNGVLPISPAAVKGTVLVTGNNAAREGLAGGGAAFVQGYDSKSCARAMEELFPGRVAAVDAPTDEQIKSASLVLVFPGFPLEGGGAEREGRDRPFVLPDDALIRRCVALNPKTVVCVIAGGGVEMDWAPPAAAIVHAFYGGQTGADALADVLAGRINPSGKLPFTIEKHFADSPGHAYADKPHDIGASFPAAMVERKRLGSFMSRENKTVIDVYNIHYKEGVFTGYRWYDAGKIEPRFAFGHGLSYTKFEYGSLAIKRMEGGRIGVSFTLKNTGRRAGDEIAQLYVADVKSSVPRPPKELKGFKRVSLAPGESQSVTIEMDAGALGFWDADAHGWKVEPGEFEVLVGPSSRDLPLRGIFEI